MPISREHFQITNPGEVYDLAEVIDTDKVASIAGPSAVVDRETVKSKAESEDDFRSPSIGDARTEKIPEEVSKAGAAILPSADPTSAEKKEAFGAAYPQRETRRNVATGRDVPQFTSRSKQSERMEFNWEEAQAQTEVYERRARTQRDAATEHLARIHDIVGLLIEMSEAHSNDGRRKLQSLESKVAELETRFAVNR